MLILDTTWCTGRNREGTDKAAFKKLGTCCMAHNGEPFSFYSIINVKSTDQSNIENYNRQRKVSKYGVISGAYFPVFGLNTEVNFITVAAVYQKLLVNFCEKNLYWRLLMEF